MSAGNFNISRRQWIWAGLYVGWWTMFALLFANVYYLVPLRRGEPKPWTEALLAGFSDMYMWGAVALAALVLAGHLPFDRGRWGRILLIHVVAGAVLVVGRIAVDHWLANQLGWADVPFAERLLIQGPSHSLIYPLLVGVGYAISYFHRFRQRELAASRLETELSRAELHALKMQLNPHFLFNTLNAISALMHRDVEAADRMIARLGDLLRFTLQAAATQEVTLRDELATLQPYLEIEQARLGERLSVRVEVGPEAYDAVVPHLILQPLVENAIRYGIAPRAVPGWIEICARRLDQRLDLQVRDSGPGLLNEAASLKGHGVGLANTRARLAGLYEANQSLELRNDPSGGLVVSINIPFRAETEGSAANVTEEFIEDPNLDRRRRAVGAGAHPQVARGRA